jgi:hypothetical protein
VFFYADNGWKFMGINSDKAGLLSKIGEECLNLEVIA